ncbi:MAG: DnaD domain protein [Candidatus Izemoplasmatales bacterium]|nr:DnaD domain protein [Candidatus Izemoplasmatales bacterium]
METLRRSDTFIVSGEGLCSEIDYQVLTLLYQPIIGQSAFTLYMTLMNLMNRQDFISDEYLHSDLESLMGMKVSEIEQERFKLEAIGLLITFFANDNFTYEIKLPLSARSFINDGILGEYLIASITKTRFKKLLKVFKVKAPNKKQKYNISKAFNEVYPSIETVDNEYEIDLVANKTKSFAKITNYNFNWRLFNETINPEVYNIENITEAVKAKIEQLSYVYGLDEIMMVDIFIKSLDDFNNINIEVLAKNARSNYHIEPVDPNKEEVQTKPVDTDNILEYFKSITPKDLLAELGDGLVSSADLRHVERLIDEVGLDSGVINVLLAYIAKIKGNNLPSYQYIQKVAMGWKRDKIDSVELALDYIKHLDSVKEKPQYRKSSRPDVAPDWLEEYLKENEGDR